MKKLLILVALLMALTLVFVACSDDTDKETSAATTVAATDPATDPATQPATTPDTTPDSTPATEPATNPAESDTTPAESDTTPAESDTTPAESDTTPAESDTTPAESDTTPAESDTTPAESDTTPAESDTTPAESDTTPAETETCVEPTEIVTLPNTTMSADTYYENETKIQDGEAQAWLAENRKDGISGVDSFAFRGWAYIDGENAREYGYVLDDGDITDAVWGFTPIVDESLFGPLNRTDVTRYVITIKMSDIPAGEHTVRLLIKTKEGTAAELAKWGTIKVKAPEKDAVIDEDGVADISGAKQWQAFDAAGYTGNIALFDYDSWIYLGKIDLSKYSQVSIWYGFDGSAVTATRFEALNGDAPIGLKSAPRSYGAADAYDLKKDIAHTDMVFSDVSWAAGQREAVIDLTAVDYNGNVWVALHNPEGTQVVVNKVVFVENQPEREPTWLDKKAEGVGFKNDSFDEFIAGEEIHLENTKENGNCFVQLEKLDNTVTILHTDKITMRGWVSFDQKVEKVGYSIDRGVVMWDKSADITSTRGDLASIANAFAYKATLSVAAESNGMHKVALVAQLADGTRVCLVEINVKIVDEFETETETETATEAETPAPAPDKYADGMYAWYEGEGSESGTTGTWEDKAGDNDMTVTIDEKNYFTEDGFHLDSATHNFPKAIVDLVNGKTFTVEILLGDDFTSIGANYNTVLNSKNDNLSLYRMVAGQPDTLWLKWASSGQPRPKKDGVTAEAMNGALLTITYNADGKVALYFNGELVSASDCGGKTMNADSLFIGQTGVKAYAATYKSIRFYDRELTAAEVMHNKLYDDVRASMAKIEDITTAGNVSCDTYYEDGASMKDGQAQAWLAENRKNGISGVSNIMFRGWAGVYGLDIDSYGYVIDGTTYVWDKSFTKPAAGAVLDAANAGEKGTRYEITVDMTKLSEGEHTLVLLVKTVDGNIYQLSKWGDIKVIGSKSAEEETKPSEDPKPEDPKNEIVDLMKETNGKGNMSADYYMENGQVIQDSLAQVNKWFPANRNNVIKDVDSIGFHGWAYIDGETTLKYGYVLDNGGIEDAVWNTDPVVDPALAAPLAGHDTVTRFTITINLGDIPAGEHVLHLLMKTDKGTVAELVVWTYKQLENNTFEVWGDLKIQGTKTETPSETASETPSTPSEDPEPSMDPTFVIDFTDATDLDKEYGFNEKVGGQVKYELNEDGYVTFTTVVKDPYVWIRGDAVKGLYEIPASKLGYVVILYRTNVEDSNTGMNLYVKTLEDGKESGWKSVNATVINDNEWHVAVIDASGKWGNTDGKLTVFRLDPMEGANGVGIIDKTCDIMGICFFETKAAAEAYAEAAEELLPKPTIEIPGSFKGTWYANDDWGSYKLVVTADGAELIIDDDAEGATLYSTVDSYADGKLILSGMLGSIELSFNQDGSLHLKQGRMQLDLTDEEPSDDPVGGDVVVDEAFIGTWNGEKKGAGMSGSIQLVIAAQGATIIDGESEFECTLVSCENGVLTIDDGDGKCTLTLTTAGATFDGGWFYGTADMTKEGSSAGGDATEGEAEAPVAPPTTIITTEDEGAACKHVAKDKIAVVVDGKNAILEARGWTSLTTKVYCYGYKLDDAEPVYDTKWITATDDSVKNAMVSYGGLEGGRFSIAATLTDLSVGKHAVQFLYVLENGTVVSFDTQNFEIKNESDSNPNEVKNIATYGGMSADTYYENVLKPALNDGQSQTWLANNRKDGISGVTWAGFRGWAYVSGKKAIAAGYVLDDGDASAAIWVDGAIVTPESGLSNATAPTVTRYLITVTLADVPAGEHTVHLLLKAEDGGVYELTTWGTIKVIGTKAA